MHLDHHHLCSSLKSQFSFHHKMWHINITDYVFNFTAHVLLTVYLFQSRRARCLVCAFLFDLHRQLLQVWRCCLCRQNDDCRFSPEPYTSPKCKWQILKNQKNVFVVMVHISLFLPPQSALIDVQHVNIYIEIILKIVN